MNKRLACFTSFLLFFSSALLAQKTLPKKENHTIVLEFILQSGNDFILTYWDDLNQIQKLEVANPSNKDTLITRSYTLKRPTHFTRGLITQSPVSKKLVTSSVDYLLLPGDTLRLAGEGIYLKMIVYSGETSQINQIFWMSRDDEFETQQYLQ